MQLGAYHVSVNIIIRQVTVYLSVCPMHAYVMFVFVFVSFEEEKKGGKSVQQFLRLQNLKKMQNYPTTRVLDYLDKT